ncbi:MAG TPA: hypothetical protein VLT33_44085 [Labilithrix sp.]|nr:hypothetical protein [Labilithrix sp.]
MKSSCVAVIVAVASFLVRVAPASAAAEGARVLDADGKVEATAFAAGVATGRAWVDVTVARRFLSGKEARAAGTRVPILVSNVVYDAPTREIVLVDGTTRTTCATLAREAVIPTGACRIVATVEPRVVDGGFGSAVFEHLVVRVQAAR